MQDDDRYLLGEVTFLSPKGFGFIVSSELQKSIYFHATSLIVKEGHNFNSLSEGQKVKFKLGVNEKGECAVEIDTI